MAASCAIPGFYRPVSIGGEPFVDGGAHSPTNADVLAGLGLDLVVVSSPMSVAGPGLRLAFDQPVRRWSRLVLETEAHRLRRQGTHVIAFQPTAADAAVIGPNPMDPDRRAVVAGQARDSALRLAGPRRHPHPAPGDLDVTPGRRQAWQVSGWPPL